MKNQNVIGTEGKLVKQFPVGDFGSEYTLVPCPEGLELSAPDSELFFTLQSGKFSSGDIAVSLIGLSAVSAFLAVIEREDRKFAALWTKDGSPASQYMVNRLRDYITFVYAGKDSDWANAASKELQNLIDTMEAGNYG